MNFEPTPDQRAFVAAVQDIAARHAEAGQLAGDRFHFATELEHDLETAGCFDAAQYDDVGRVGAALIVMELAKLPQVCESVASMLIAPAACADLARPLAVLWDGIDRPARFLPQARTVLAVDGDAIAVASLEPGDVDPIDSTFAYPFGMLAAPSTLEWHAVRHIEAHVLRDLWRIGVAAEIVGCLDAGLQAVLDHVKTRRQFGRPLGAFQAIQHRLAECATLLEAARWLTLKAAHGARPLDIAVAVARAQDAVVPIAYDLHQFTGAMGLTLEHPLHRFTYRARLLRSELGGADRHFIAAAEAAWGAS